MKFRSIKPALVLIAVLSLAATSCLKDNDLDKGRIQATTGSTAKVISLGINVRAASNFSTLAYNNSPNDTTVNLVPVELGGTDPAPQDLHVTLETVDSLVDKINADNAASGNGNSDYVVPTGKYSIVSTTVVIKKGERTGFLQIKFTPFNLIGQNYAIGFAIKSVTEPGYVISGNIGKGVVAVLTKNKYDGLYNAKGFFVHPSLGGPFVHKNLVVATSGTFSVDLEAQPYSGGLLGAYPRLTIDPNTNAVTVTSYDPATTFNGPEPGYVNRYDPATKTFYINYGYVTSAPREAWDTLTFSRPR